MTIKCEKLTKKAHRSKDDTYVVKDNFLYAVINGAPFLYPKNKDLNFTTPFLNDLRKALADYDGRSRLAMYLYNFSREEYQKFESLHDKDSSYLPGCGIAIAFLQDDVVEFYTLGDCNIVYQTKDGQKFLMEDESVQALDKEAIDKLVAIAEDKNIAVKKALKFIPDHLIENRQKLNSEEQTDLFTVLENPHFKFTHRRILINDLDFIYLFSDGFASAYKYLKLYSSFEKMFDRVLDITEVEDMIIELWSSDKKMNDYPRLSYKDDMAVIKLLFND